MHCSAAHLCEAGHHTAGGAAEAAAATRCNLGPPPAVLGKQLHNRLLAAATAACLALCRSLLRKLRLQRRPVQLQGCVGMWEADGM